DGDGSMHHLREDREVERRPCVRSRLDDNLLDTQLAVHTLAEPPADRRTDDGHRITGLDLLRLHHRFVAQPAPKYPGRHSATGVAHAEVELEEVPARLRAQLDADAALFRALDASMKQGQQNLLDAARVSDDDARNVGLGAKREVQALASRLFDDHPQAGLHACADVEGVKRQLELSALDESGIQNRVEKPRNSIGTGLDD